MPKRSRQPSRLPSGTASASTSTTGAADAARTSRSTSRTAKNAWTWRSDGRFEDDGVLMTGQEHLAAIQAAIKAAKEDGFLLEFQSYGFESQYVQLFLWQNRRGEDGVMR